MLDTFQLPPPLPIEHATGITWQLQTRLERPARNKRPSLFVQFINYAEEGFKRLAKYLQDQALGMNE